MVAWVETEATWLDEVSDCLASGEYQDLMSDWGGCGASTNDYFSTAVVQRPASRP
jgi:hypothetical protein